MAEFVPLGRYRPTLLRIAEGYPQLRWIENDCDMEPLRVDHRFQEIVAPLSTRQGRISA